MQTWMVVVQVVLLVLGVPLVILAIVMAIFAGGKGSPIGQSLFVTFMTVPLAYLVALPTSVWLFTRKRGGHALVAAACPLLYLLLAFILAAIWADLTSR
ncbi:hypothetical protein DESA109040_04330 [Deinococcus saxicola]|uniref:hypothetical protein n=1 Tax=Deinococcus saxicola TaxID=249406 RepID=UPI0039F01910